MVYGSIGGNKMTKEDYINFTNEHYTGEAKDLILKQIDLFFDNTEIINKTKYFAGDDVILEKGTHIHGIPGLLDNFDWVIKNGFIGNDFTNQNTANKIKSSIGMWNIQETIKLRNYIEQYSGFTITYTIGRGPGSKEVSELIPYHKFDEFTEKLNDREDVWMYWGDGTKETRFIPSLVANKRQIAFILNMSNKTAQELVQNDVWNPNFTEETIKPFLDYRYYEKFLQERHNRTAATTNRETAIIFGLPSRLIEGVFVGRKIEADKNALAYIKEKLPDCYICSLDGKVIVGNAN